MNKMNWKGWLVLLAEVVVVAALVAVTIGNRVTTYNWERGVESRIELASKGGMDVIDARLDGDAFLLFINPAGEMTEKALEDTQQAEYDAVEEAGKGFFIIYLVRSNRERDRWYAFATLECATALYLESGYSSCDYKSPIWMEIPKKHTRWAN